MPLPKFAFLTIPLAVGATLGLLLLSLTSAPATAQAGRALAAATGPTIIDDFEAGIPPGFVAFADSFDGSGSDTRVEMTTSTVDLPTVPAMAASTAVSVSYFIDPDIPWGFPGYGGVTRDFAEPQDWSGHAGFGFWLAGSGTGGGIRVELKSDGGDPAGSNRYQYTFQDDVAGWRYFAIPFADFVRRTDFNPGPSPDDPINLARIWGYSLLLVPGAAGSLQLDQVMLTKSAIVHDFEAGIPPGFVAFADSFDGSGSDTRVEMTTSTVDLPTVPAMAASTAVSVSYFIDPDIPWGFPGYGGVTFDYAAAEDWSDYWGFGFWLAGSGTGGGIRVELKSDGGDPAGSNRYQYTFQDDVAGWRYFAIPFADFVRRTDFNPGPSPDDPINLARIWGYSLLLVPGAAGSLQLDQVELLGAPAQEFRVQFSSETYSAPEGETATVTVTLNAAAAEPITVTYATADGTAIAGIDYVAASGMLAFAPGETAQTFMVQTIDNDDDDDDRTILLALSDPISATLGGRSQATLTILDDEETTPSGKTEIVDDFESGLPSGQDDNGIGIGFVTWSDPGGSTVALTTTAAVSAGLPPIPGSSGPNSVLQMEHDIVSWGGFTHAFEDEALTQWLSQDWSAYEGVCFWLYGTGSGAQLFFDILDNRNPGSTGDDAERFTYPFTDDAPGWRFLQIPFGEFTRKEIGNGAPNDGFGRSQVWGWAFGSLNSGGPQTLYLDDVGLIVRTTVVDDFERGLPSGQDDNGIGIGFVTWSDPGGSTVAITTTAAVSAGLPPIPGSSGPNSVLQMEHNIVSWGGFTHAFEDEALTQWLSQDWSAYEGVCFWLYGTGSGAQLFFDILDNRNPGSTGDDAERFTYPFTDDAPGWRFLQIPFGEFTRKEIGNGAPNDGFGRSQVWGWAFGSLNSGGPQTLYLDDVVIYGATGGDRELEVTFAAGAYSVAEGAQATITVTLNMTHTEPVSVTYATAESSARPDRDFTPTSGRLVFAPGATEQTFTVTTADNTKHTGDRKVILALRDPENAVLGFQRRAVLTILENDTPDLYLLDDFEGFHRYEITGSLSLSVTEVMTGDPLALPGQGVYEHILTVNYGLPEPTLAGDGFLRRFPEAQDWSGLQGVSFWHYGSNSGDAFTVELLDNQNLTTGDVDPADWVLVWSDEFDDPAGAPPNPNAWTHELGDGTLNDIPGWGNSELQYYTDSPDNAATDGLGNLVITVSEVETGTTQLLCWYGPCQYTSARLISAQKAEFAYGRLEARIKTPFGAGLWPAFWTLGTNIDEVGWPQSGEIDIMEYVGREPNQVFGTIHGPGYSGGSSFGDVYDFDFPVSDDFHTFAIEWAPDEIHWYVDDINYHNAQPADVAPNEWVYNHPFFLLLNVAVGGNFGGPVGADTPFPQTMLVDYVRVYQAPDNAERFEAAFVDDFSGWRQIAIPFSDFTRSAEQPAGAPNDGLGLTEVWGYGLALPANASGSFHIDQVRLQPRPAQRTYLPLILIRQAPTAVGLTGLSAGSAARPQPLLPVTLALAAALALATASARRRRSR